MFPSRRPVSSKKQLRTVFINNVLTRWIFVYALWGSINYESAREVPIFLCVFLHSFKQFGTVWHVAWTFCALLHEHFFNAFGSGTRRFLMIPELNFQRVLVRWFGWWSQGSRKFISACQVRISNLEKSAFLRPPPCASWPSLWAPTERDLTASARSSGVISPHFLDACEIPKGMVP